MNTTQISCFLSLAKTLNFSETAAELYLSQQAVSKNIANLESELGTRLFNRNHHKVSLSEEGRQYHAFFARCDSEFKSLKKEIDKDKNIETVHLRCGYQIGLDFGSVPYDTQKDIQEGRPGFSHTCERRSPIMLQQMLLAGELDLIVIYRHFVSPDAGLMTHDLASFPVILMVSPDNPNAVPGASFTDFRFTPFIFDSEDISNKNNDIRSKAMSFAKDAGIEPAQILLVYNRETAFSAAEQGLGFILTSRFSRIYQNPYLKSYSTNGNEMLTAVWRSDADQQLIGDYVSALENNIKDYARQTQSMPL